MSNFIMDSFARLVTGLKCVNPCPIQKIVVHPDVFKWFVSRQEQFNLSLGEPSPPPSSSVYVHGVEIVEAEDTPPMPRTREGTKPTTMA